MATAHTVPCEPENPRDLMRRLRLFFCSGRDQIGGMVKNTLSCWSDDKAPRLAASLAYYTALSLAPLIVVVLAIAGLAFGRAAAQGQLVWQIREITGPSGARAIQALVDGARKPATGILATAL